MPSARGPGSPTGDRVAFAHPVGIRVVNLVSGYLRTYPVPDSTVDELTPAAWLPDGIGLVALATTYPDDPTTPGVRRQLSILDLFSGALDTFTEAI
jgi:hypothetical protein